MIIWKSYYQLTACLYCTWLRAGKKVSGSRKDKDRSSRISRASETKGTKKDVKEKPHRNTRTQEIKDQNTERYVKHQRTHKNERFLLFWCTHHMIYMRPQWHNLNGGGIYVHSLRHSISASITLHHQMGILPAEGVLLREKNRKIRRKPSNIEVQIWNSERYD